MDGWEGMGWTMEGNKWTDEPVRVAAVRPKNQRTGALLVSQELVTGDG